MSENNSAVASAEEIELVITRVFDAPREVVWRAWSEAEGLAQWWGPKGFDLQVKHLDFRPGGVFHYCMVASGGATMWGKFVYGEIIEPERLDFTNSFSDEDGNITRAPFFDGKWALQISHTVKLIEENGKTTMTIRGRPINATEIELQTFAEAHSSMHEGYGGTFDKLDEYLAKA